MHQVEQLFHYRKSIATKAFNARGKKVDRCEQCRVAKKHCICAHRPTTQSELGFALLMYDAEVLKPSNTGWLIADLVPNTFAYLWHRTEVDSNLLVLLNDEQWQPFLVFPKQYASAQQQVFEHQLPELQPQKKPLFILLDASWKEAKKMFRKSPYLAQLPVISLNFSDQTMQADYQLRKAANKGQFATVEVAAKLAELAGEQHTSSLLAAWFEVFKYHYQLSVCQPNQGDAQALDKLLKLTGHS